MFSRKTASTFFFAAALALAGCGSTQQASSDPSTSDVTASATPSETASPTPSPTPTQPATTAAPTSSAEPTVEKTPEATPTPEPTTAEAKNLAVAGEITQRGVSCGKVTDDKALIMAAAPAALSCDAAKEVVAQAINTGVVADTEVYGFTCHGRDEATTVLDGRSVTCVSGETRLEAMENYTLAGAPVTSTADYPTQFGNIQVYGFRANGVECYFGKVGGVSCWRPSVVNSLPYEVASISRTTGFKIEAPADLQDGAAVNNTSIRDLGVGEVITTNGMSCDNDGTYTSCRVGDYWFKINATELKNS